MGGSSHEQFFSDNKFSKSLPIERKLELEWFFNHSQLFHWTTANDLNTISMFKGWHPRPWWCTLAYKWGPTITFIQILLLEPLHPVWYLCSHISIPTQSQKYFRKPIVAAWMSWMEPTEASSSEWRALETRKWSLVPLGGIDSVRY